MPKPIPRIRANLEFLPSPLPDQPGLMIRDAYEYSEVTVILPPLLAQCLACFDGQQTELELREMLVRLTGALEVGELVEHLTHTLSSAGFLEDEIYHRMREARRRQFAESPIREPAQAGLAYPEGPEELQERLDRYLGGDPVPASHDRLVGVAAPHVSLEGGRESYAAAYRALGGEHRDRTFVVLGTSHHGEPGRFGLTRKPFRTPLGEAVTDSALVDWLGEHGGDGVEMEDYCHAVEHSIEFQVIFLQHILGPGVRILPILCGSFSWSLIAGGVPEDEESVRGFLGALGELAAREEDRLFWVLGVDMAHIGRRYGDRMQARAEQGQMVRVGERDRERIQRVVEGDSRGFWELVRENRDDLRWCGAAPLYTFLRAVPQARGELLRYQQWNIDDESVVSFAALSFGC